MATTATIGGDGKLFVGEDKILRLSLSEDMSGWTIIFDVRSKDTSEDPALLSKQASIVGTWNAVAASNTQRAEVVLTDDDMNIFRPKVYRYSWKRMDANNETVLARGPFAPEKATAP